MGSERLEGGPGWYIDGETLLPVVENVSIFRRAHAADPAVEVLLALWTGRADEAESLLRPMLAASGSRRLRALRADSWRDQGRIAEAIAEYEALVEEVVGTSSEAVMQQHLGKALFTAGRPSEASQCFKRALNLRLQGNAHEALVASSRAALRRAQADSSDEPA